MARVYRLRLFGHEVASWEIDGDDPTEMLAAAIAELADAPEDDDTEDDLGITSGVSHNFERDITPVSPDDRYRWDDWDGFGFGCRG